MAMHILKDDNDAWRALGDVLASVNGDDAIPLSFSGWPYLHVVLEPGDGRGSPEILKAMTELQKAIYAAFALYKYGVPDIRRLTGQERAQLAPEWEVRQGSTKVMISLARAATYFLRTFPSRMTGAQRTLAVLGLGLAVVSATAYVGQLYLTNDLEKERIKTSGQTEIALAAVALTREHTEHMRMLKAAYERDQTHVVRYAAADLLPWRPALLAMAPMNGTIAINGIVIPGPVAHATAKTLKAESTKQRRQLKSAPQPTAIEARWITTVTRHDALPPPMRLGARSV